MSQPKPKTHQSQTSFFPDSTGASIMPNHFDWYNAPFKSQSSLINTQVTDTSPLIWTYLPQTAGLSRWRPFPTEPKALENKQKWDQKSTLNATWVSGNYALLVVNCRITQTTHPDTVVLGTPRHLPMRQSLDFWASSGREQIRGPALCKQEASQNGVTETRGSL